MCNFLPFFFLQVLSRAFRNRFVELHFDEIPPSELEMILHMRCEVPLSYSKKMVAVLRELQKMRRGTNIFQVISDIFLVFAKWIIDMFYYYTVWCFDILYCT